MPMFAVQLFDLHGKAIEPGFGGSIYRSPSPLPVPLVGETVDTMDGEWQVKRRRFKYDIDENGQTCVLVTLQCAKVAD